MKLKAAVILVVHLLFWFALPSKGCEIAAKVPWGAGDCVNCTIVPWLTADLEGVFCTDVKALRTGEEEGAEGEWDVF